MEMKTVTFDETKWRLVPIEPTKEMCIAAVKFANGNAVYKNVAPAALEIEEGIYGETYAAMLATSPSPRTPEQPEQPILLWQHFDHSRPTGERMFWSHHSDRAKALADPDKSFNETCDTQPARTLPQSDPAGDQQHQHDDQHDADAAARPPAPAG